MSGKIGASEAKLYTEVNEVSGRYLTNRDAKPWLDKISGKSALDYGSGLGYSSEFLNKQGFQVVGVDINPHMIKSATHTFPSTHFILINKNQVPFPNQSFDLVYSCFVLFEIDSLENIRQHLAEGTRVLKEGGYFIAITGSQHVGDRKYKSVLNITDYPENENPKSGSIIKVTSPEINITFNDYFWTEEDYRKVFAKAGLDICEVHYPLGKDNEGYDWQAEKTKSPFVMFLAKKSKSQSNNSSYPA
jgi:ubiquinone/menaquinone biosynthesis C-methylase UbiE